MKVTRLTFKTANTPEQLKTTIRLIGKAIRDGSLYPPLRHLAAKTATRAAPKDYWGQIQQIYDAIIYRLWRYVYDPPDAEWLALSGLPIFKMILNGGEGPNKNGSRGYGDCDDITIGAGSLLRSLNMDLRIATTAPPNSPHIFNHVFLMVKPPRSKKWLAFDPVIYPKPNHGVGQMVQHDRIAFWDLEGNLIAKSGKFPPRFEDIMALYGDDHSNSVDYHMVSGDDSKMQRPQTYNTRRPNYHDFEDYSAMFGDDALFGDDTPDENNQFEMEHAARNLPDFSIHGILGFGSYAGMMGCKTGADMPHIMAEYDESDMIGNTGLVRTKHFEMSPDDYDYMLRTGQPKVGALSLADDGDVYEWQKRPGELGGIWKKLGRAVVKGAKKVVGVVKKPIKKLFMRTKFGRKLWKVGGKLYNTALKVTKFLIKKVGPIAEQIAPVAALIPGVGPIIAGGLLIVGRVAAVLKKYDIPIDEMGRPQPKNKEQARVVARELAKEGRRLGKPLAQKALDFYNEVRKQNPGLPDYVIKPIAVAKWARWRAEEAQKKKQKVDLAERRARPQDKKRLKKIKAELEKEQAENVAVQQQQARQIRALKRKMKTAQAATKRVKAARKQMGQMQRQITQLKKAASRTSPADMRFKQMQKQIAQLRRKAKQIEPATIAPQYASQQYYAPTPYMPSPMPQYYPQVAPQMPPQMSPQPYQQMQPQQFTPPQRRQFAPTPWSAVILGEYRIVGDHIS